MVLESRRFQDHTQTKVRIMTMTMMILYYSAVGWGKRWTTMTPSDMGWGNRWYNNYPPIPLD